MTPIQLDGTKPLFDTPAAYVEWVQAHEGEVYAAYERHDENAELILFSVEALNLQPSPRRMAIFQIAVERHIAKYHPEIAVIVRSK